MNTAAPSPYARKTFKLEELDVREENSKYPYQDLAAPDAEGNVDGFLFRGPTASISGRTSSENKKGEKTFVNRKTTNPADGESSPGAGDGASEKNPFTWVVRIK